MHKLDLHRLTRSVTVIGSLRTSLLLKTSKNFSFFHCQKRYNSRSKFLTKWHYMSVSFFKFSNSITLWPFTKYKFNQEYLFMAWWIEQLEFDERCLLMLLCILFLIYIHILKKSYKNKYLKIIHLDRLTVYLNDSD